ncbi:DUF4390 domain-containing protein [Massilia cavernae]|uniref:DUF4390 domain-containing protein n=1 Tax=Massilia cavernae TaxID=2320864 RepID=A0A418XSC7_9BURK|nr:DUF4390 domain-containing protein [Massilia cavernae]RJG15430.1 DUF4390 domain-containing protein [Massilia cavernae]
MTLRFLRLLVCQLLLALACVQAHAADGVDVTRARIEASEDGYKLDAAYAFDLNPGLEDAIHHGVHLYFTTEVQLTRPRWYWRDEKAASARQTIRINYNVLTRQYIVLILGSVQQTFPTLEDALFLIRRPSRWVIAPRGALKQGETYDVRLRMGMNRDYLSKPIQVNAFSNSGWRLSSDTKTFTYKAE